MSVADVTRLLNTLDRETNPPSLRFDDSFRDTENGAVARYENFTLSSLYAPIKSSAGDQLHGHVAVLDVRNDLDRKLDSEVVFARPETNNEFVRLDRLVRTLHALNYLRHPTPQRLFVKVNLRHIESVEERHGEVFAAALRACNLEPQSITLLINIVRKPNDAMVKALDSYRARGYRIALSRQGHEWIDIRWLYALKPDVVVLDSDLLQKPEILDEAIRHLRAGGWRTLIEVDGSTAQVVEATAALVDFLQYPAEAIAPAEEQSPPARARGAAPHLASAASL